MITADQIILDEAKHQLLKIKEMMDSAENLFQIARIEIRNLAVKLHNYNLGVKHDSHAS